MLAGKYDINVSQGSSTNLFIAYQDSAGASVDLNNHSARMQVRRSQVENKLLLYLTGSSGGTYDGGLIIGITGPGSTGFFVDGTTAAGGCGGSAGVGGITLSANTSGVTLPAGTGTTGGIYLSIDALTLADVPTGNHFYDLELVTGNDVTRILEGRFNVTGEITR